jgi:antitoxin HigA-1
MTTHNPPHPGEFIASVYLEPNGISGRELPSKLGVSPWTLNRILTGRSSVSPEMALRLSKCLGRSPESWLAMQAHHLTQRLASAPQCDQSDRSIFAPSSGGSRTLRPTVSGTERKVGVLGGSL